MNTINPAPGTLCWQLLAFAAIANAMLPGAVTALNQHNALAALLGGLNHSHVVWVALLICLLLAPAIKVKRLFNEWRLEPYRLMFCLLSVLLVIPLANLSWLLAALAGVIWLRRTPATTSARAAPLLVIALALREPATQAALLLFSEQILGLDSVLAAALVRLSDQPITLAGNILVAEGRHGLLILTGCSAFGNLSHALLLWLSLMLWRPRQLLRSDSFRVVLLIVLVVAMNSVRLALMSQSPALYRIIHDGWGAAVFDSLVLVIPILLTRWRLAHAHRHSAYQPAVH